MGNKTQATYRRLGIPTYQNRSNKLPVPIVLRDIDLDLYGWDNPRPSTKHINSSIINNLIIQQETYSWLKQLGFNFIWRIRIIDYKFLLFIHVFYIRAEFPLTNTQPYLSGRLLDIKTNKIIDSKYLANALGSKLKTNQKIVFTFYHINNLVNNKLINLLDQSLSRTYIKSIKTKGIINAGFIAATLLKTYPCRQLIRQWLAYALSKEKHPRFILNFVQDLINLVGEDKNNNSLHGIQIKVKGRLGGVDKATAQRIFWGRIPRETLSAGITNSQAEAHTPYGLYGITVISYHQ